MSIWKVQRTGLLVGLTALLLVALAIMQHRWVGELSQFHREQTQRALEASTAGFVRDLNREFRRIQAAFDIGRFADVGQELLDEHREWTEAAAFPEMISEILWADWTPGDDETEGTLRLRRLQTERERLEPMTWPASLAVIEQELRQGVQPFERRARPVRRISTRLDDGRLAFVIGQDVFRTPSWAIVLLEPTIVAGQAIPFILDQYFGPAPQRAYDVWILDRATGGTIFASNPGADAADPAAADIQRRLDDDGFGWIVAARHRAGSVDAFVEQYRIRNVSLGFGIVGVLGLSLLFLLVAARRAQSLAERQMEFVAGVSHELRTPIAGISSLSQNLADGVVGDLDQAARYGESINQESRRLRDMVEVVLGFASIRSHRHLDRKPVDLGSLVEDELEALDRAEKAPLQVDRRIEHPLPPVWGDERALRSVVRNLVSNAVKFGGDQPVVLWVRRAEADPREVELGVQDRGPGIARTDLPHIFEPFYRGQDAHDAQVPGSGLGLSLVQEIVTAHRGRVDVDSRPGEGAIFRVHLPLTEPKAAHGRS